MELSSDRHAWSSAAVRIWIIVWMLAVPLFHIHPEADHRHGQADHVHGGTVHTVFSPDLDGEFVPHGKTATARDRTIVGSASFSSHPAQAADYTELGFSFVSDSTDRSLSKLISPLGIPAVPPADLTEAVTPPGRSDLSFTLPFTLLTRDIPSRAPPTFVL